MANKVELGCPQTKGTFVLSGKVTGRFSNGFYQEGTGQNGNDWRRVRLGVEIEPDRIVYIELFGSVHRKGFTLARPQKVLMVRTILILRLLIGLTALRLLSSCSRKTGIA